MEDVNVATTGMRCDVRTSASQNSPPCSTQSSPYSSNISELEVDVSSSLSRQSSCSSLNQQNAPFLTNVMGTNTALTNPLLNGEGHASRTISRTCNNHGRTELESLIRTRTPCIPDIASDEDVTAEDCISNNSIMHFHYGRRNTVEQSGITWRSPLDVTATELERKALPPRTLTPSPSASGRSSPACHALPSHSRVLNIRRESNSCTMESEAAHERLMQIAQQVSMGFDDFSIGDNGERKRTHSLSEPISVLTNAFIPHSCSPSPTRAVDVQKQCYSPSTQQIVRNNITYSPSPSPTPSPTRRIMRSLSPIAVRQMTKRRYTSSVGGEMDSDSRTTGASVAKRVCQQPFGGRVCPSPLALENSASSVESTTKSSELTGTFSSPFTAHLLVDPAIEVKMPPPMELDESRSSINEQNSSSAVFQKSRETGKAGRLKKDA